MIDAAMDAIEQENKKLKGVLPKTFARPELDKRRPGEVVDLFTNIAVAANGGTMDLLGRAYEYCLSLISLSRCYTFLLTNTHKAANAM